MHAARVVLRALVGTSGALTAFVLMLMVFHIVAEILSRNLFGKPLPGTTAIVAHYYMIALTFLPLALIERRNAHISVEIVTELLPTALQRLVAVLGWLFSLTVFCILAYTSWTDATRRYRMGSFVLEGGTELPIWPSYFLLPLGYVLICGIFLMRFGLLITRGSAAFEQTDPLANPATPVRSDR